MISASVDIGGDDRESPSIGADQRRRDVQAMLTASHRTGSTRTRPGRLRDAAWTSALRLCALRRDFLVVPDHVHHRVRSLLLRAILERDPPGAFPALPRLYYCATCDVHDVDHGIGSLRLAFMVKAFKAESVAH